MARVTVEDCINKVPNRFKLVLMAAKRARDIERGAKPSVVRDNDKSTILALREIAEDAISLETLEDVTKQSIVNDESEMLHESESEHLRDEELERRINNEDNDETDGNPIDDDEEWEMSDNLYSERYSVDMEEQEEISEDKISNEIEDDDYNNEEDANKEGYIIDCKTED